MDYKKGLLTFAFNEGTGARISLPERGLTFAIRTDAAFSTAPLKQKIMDDIRARPGHPLGAHPDLDARIRSVVHTAYQVWGHAALSALAHNIDYSRYNLDKPEDEQLHIHFYNTHSLTSRAITIAEKLVSESPEYDPACPVMYVSLDDLIQKQRDHWVDIGFSRLFDHDGVNHFGYTNRPGMAPLEDQIAQAKAYVDDLARRHGKTIPVVLLEDNVRHASMINWVIDLLEARGFFDNTRLAAVSTCFCCACDDERNRILHKGKVVPLAVVIDYEDKLVDVSTPRDLLLDGFVVEVNGKNTRLPGIFMDVVSRFKIRPEQAGAFKLEVINACEEFCRTLERDFAVTLPVSWFRGADAIAHKSTLPDDRPMLEVLAQLKRALLQSAAVPEGQIPPPPSPP